MIKVKKILYAGGFCPYQCEFLTEDGEHGYLRYRGGVLRCGVGKDKESFFNRVTVYNIFDEAVGDEYDGCPNHEVFQSHLKDLIEFPTDFNFEKFVEDQR
jgi:hypothetical protein